MKLNPKTCPIQGDLSRNDVIELNRHCRGKRVQEFGMGGSTLLLGRVASELWSYETNQLWYDRTVKRFDQMAAVTDVCLFHPVLGTDAVPASIPKVDVLWLDGMTQARAYWVKYHFGSAPKIIIHDARRGPDVSAVLGAALERFLEISVIEFCPGNSNLLVIRKRDVALEYENWNVTEANDNRVPADHPDYVADVAHATTGD